MNKQYNTNETLAVLTSYPNPENGRYGTRALNAVGWHSERLIKQLGKNRRVLVLAEEDGNRSEFKAGKNVLVQRVWKKGNPLSILKVGSILKEYSSIKSILIQFEFNVFGGTIPNLYLLLLMIYLRLLGKRVSFEFHQVILDIKQLEKHVNITNPLLQAFYNVSLRLYYFLVGVIVNNIIVFEVELKRRLESFVNRDKIFVLSLAVDKKKRMQKGYARRMVNKNLVFKNHPLEKNEFVLLVFGFINGYKGIDWIIEQLKGVHNKNIRLLVVGGRNPYLANKASYQAFYNQIVSELKKHKNMSYVDFVPERDIPIYYSAADLAVIPYEVFMAASGPFSHALAYDIPVIISKHLSEYTESQDIVAAVNESEIKLDDFIFEFTKKDLLRVVTNLINDSELYKRLSNFSQKLGRLRSMQRVSIRLDNILFPHLYAPREQKSLTHARQVFTLK